MKRFIHIAALFFCPLLAFAQQYYLKGQVKDEAGYALQNVSIYLHSTGYVYYSGAEGTFGIPSNNKIDTITFSYEGYLKQKLVVDATVPIDVKLKKTAITKNVQGYRLASLTQNLKREAQQQWFAGDETYASIIENQFINAFQYPTTGLTLNVDKASYSNIRRFLNMDMLVPPDAVRMEEMLNYFNLDYTEPSGGKTFEIKTTFTQCPWNKNNQLLFAQIVSKKLSFDSLPPSHLVFLIDVSGSMDMPNRLPLLKSGFKTLVNNLRPIDSVSIVVYGGTVGIALPTTSGKEKEIILKTIDSLQAGGSTPGESGIKLAYSVAKNHFIKGGNNRIILATDGDFNVGLKKEDELEEMISVHKQQGVYLTCLGIGMGNYKDSKIQALAQRGNGNFAYLDSYAEAEKVLLKEFTQTLYTVADDAYLNVKFNPNYVKEYRLIGFDNKMGAIKDTSATVEGGVIGSAYSALIAFEIAPVVAANNLLGIEIDDSLVSFNLQYKLPDSTDMLQLIETPKIRLASFNSIPKYYQFASAVIMFGGMLRKSKFVKDVSWNYLIETATHAVDAENYSQKEFLSMVQRAKNVYSKKRKKGKEDW
ncbi:MAG TPA: von Willebrand factor type A domain-containing protein [Flavisolibacter sp.]|nr:von Willebrand factor type A domain-containing protein [Flavisolibacter sp.]